MPKYQIPQVLSVSRILLFMTIGNVRQIVRKRKNHTVIY